jgi:hypothetical protein
VKLEDNSDELSVLLEALYNLERPIYFIELSDERRSFSLIYYSIAMFKNSNSQYAQATSILQCKVYPVSCASAPSTNSGHCCSASVERLTEDDRAKQMARLFSIVELSKNCGLLQFLPIALYRIGRLLAPNGTQDNHLLITVSEFAWLINIWACKCIIPSALIFLIIQWTNHGPCLHVNDKNRT